MGDAGAFAAAPSPIGRPPAFAAQEIVNAIFYVLCGSIPWRMLPDYFPPRQTVYRWFSRYRDRGVWEGINHHLVVHDRERVGHDDSPPPR